MWLLEESVKNAIENAELRGFTPNAEQIAAFDASLTAQHGSADRIMTVAENTAQIEIVGVLTEYPNIMAQLFGGGNTTYPDIRAAILVAEGDPKITKTKIKIKSPGGTIEGLFETLSVMQAAKKPIEIEASKATSAAYALAAQGHPIIGTEVAAQFGSIGVAQGFRVDDSVIELASTKAPKKRPDITTEAGKAIVREELDAIHDLFVDAIAQGRGISADKVNEDFGEGATLLADEALKRGMIDSIKTVEHTAKPTTATHKIGGKQQEKRSMDLTTLKASHPDVYAAAAKEGQIAERDRVTSFLVAGQMSGDMKAATTAIKEGSEMTMTLQTQFMMAAANKSDVQNRQDDDQETELAAAINNDTNDEEAEAAAGNNILALAAASCNVELESK